MIQGIHHITAISGNINKNIRFYTEILGLQFIKKTVNYDSPDTWHLYFGSSPQNPGTTITFFPFAGFSRGKSGNGSVKVTAFSVSSNSLDFWMKRLREYQVACRGPIRRFDEEYLALEDFDGLELELVANDKDLRSGQGTPGINEVNAIKGFHHAELSYSSVEKTAGLLTGVLFHERLQEENGRLRLFSHDALPGNYLDLVGRPSLPAQQQGAGTVHHLALNTPDEDHQKSLAEKLSKTGIFTTEVKDRQYFKSVYFREPGGTLLEIATHGPGFLVDETPETLGQRLQLPPWIEHRRKEIESLLPAIDY